MQGPQLIAITLLLFCSGFVSHANAQTPKADPVIENIPGQTASPFLLEPEIEVKGDRIKSETYRSQPAGQNQNWNLDIGRFQPKIDDDPSGLVEDDKPGYSGMRLRLPLRGGIRQ